MVRVIAAAFLLVPECDAAGLGGHENDLGVLLQEAGVNETVDNEDGSDGASGVHALLVFPVGAFLGA